VINHPIEGDELLLKDGSLWIVKGCLHLGNGYVAVPRVADGQKLKTYIKQFTYIRRYYLHYLKNIPQIGLPTPLVHSEDIIKYLNVTGKIPDGRNHLKLLANKLIRTIQDSCTTECGITGSLLGNYSSEGSDIDLVCVDSINFPECLKRLRDKEILHPITDREFIREYQEVKEIINEELHQKLVELKLTQGFFKGAKYTLKIINCDRERSFAGPYLYVRKAKLLIRLLSTDYRTPSIYEVKLLRPHAFAKKAYMITYRVRFTELPEGSLIRGEGLMLYKDTDSVIITFDRTPSRIEYLVIP